MRREGGGAIWGGSDRMTVSYAEADLLRTLARNPAIARVKQRGHELLQLLPGQRVLDLGCGPGIDTVRFAERVGPTGQVVGVDRDPAMVAEADAEAARAGVQGRTLHQLGDAALLPFAAASFDACYCERMFQYLPPPKSWFAMAEAARVTRPGGSVVVADADGGTLSVDTDEVDVERRIVRTHLARLTNGYAGRQLYRMMRQLGLVDVSAEMFDVPLGYAEFLYLLGYSEQLALSAGTVSPSEWLRWRASLARAHATGSFFAHLVIVLVVGVRT
jgi:ubiquinone/menaquinone biosynthesis C-methylase UbiE